MIFPGPKGLPLAPQQKGEVDETRKGFVFLGHPGNKKTPKKSRFLKSFGVVLVKCFLGVKG